VYGIVRADGRRAQRVNYPFYDGDTSTFEFTPEARLNLGSVVLRESKLLARPFPLAEYFEDSLLEVNQGPQGGVRIKTKRDSLNADGTFWKKGGFGLLSTAAGQNKTMELAASQAVKLPQSTNRALYAEVDFRADVPFTVGLYTPENNPLADVIVAASPNQWRRIYVFLSEEASTVAEGTPMRLFIQGLTSDTTQAHYIAVDNIRLLHFKPRL
jgi:hypothetical protein